MSAATATARMTADEFLRDYGDASGVELVNGLLVELPMPGTEHGGVCVKAIVLMHPHIERHALGRLVSNDTYVRITEDPATFRGANICFIGSETLPLDRPLPNGPLVPPLEMVVEVRSPTDNLRQLYVKAGEYLEAGVKVVVVLDPPTRSAAVFRNDELPQRFHNGDLFEVPDVLPGFDVPVLKFFG